MTFCLKSVVDIASGIADHIAHAVEHAVEILRNGAAGVWHFAVKLAGQVHHAVLSTVDAVVGAVEWMFHAVETAIEDIIQFLKLLFEWDNIKQTKNIICNLTKLRVTGQIEDLSAAWTTFNCDITSLGSIIDQALVDLESGLDCDNSCRR
ncbi:uncharacterized protein FRV6_14203 [Fusarium oxysporum]|uniref:Uncharacterized protein n=1 Tax=Fusarium oxysporum TaxID=5507 RepID=A0A2H3TQX2_FUSOX|nr:uncharacterized protein FRV6_14203 [Fusarium oxysporum]